MITLEFDKGFTARDIAEAIDDAYLDNESRILFLTGIIDQLNSWNPGFVTELTDKLKEI